MASASSRAPPEMTTTEQLPERAPPPLSTWQRRQMERSIQKSENLKHLSRDVTGPIPTIHENKESTFLDAAKLGESYNRTQWFMHGMGLMSGVAYVDANEGLATWVADTANKGPLF